jgi:hypothetical protein
MKSFKTGLHLYMLVASLVTFLGGWIVLAHSRKPVSTAAGSAGSSSPTSLISMPTLVLVQSYGSYALPSTRSNSSTLLQGVPSAPQSGQSSSPMFRTGGS